MNFRQLRRPEVSINLTPLIDVVFLLLIFFMVSTSFSELTQLVVDLPEAEGIPASADNTVLLVVDVQGNMTLDG
ncbi:MAG: biopolymer transporter ExbD, partial [Halieaceae bacterium]